MALIRSSPSVYVGGTLTKTGRATRTISDVRIDPRYNPPSASYDFAILLLDKPVEITTPFVLNMEANIPTDNAALAVVGYGRTSQGDETTSSTLQETSVNYRANCTDTYGDGRVKDYEMMCAHDPNYSRDACQGMLPKVGGIVIPCLLIVFLLPLGDSGGPLIFANNVIVGVVSWGEGRFQR
jgi:trypsin